MPSPTGAVAMPIEVFRTAREMSARCTRVRAGGRRLAFVPTMGSLHAGHLSLVGEGLRRADVCAVSIFVNPTQFGPTEDLARYPRDLEGDLERCDGAGATLAYAPEPEEMYPDAYQTYVEVTDLQKGICGDRRPGHFRGVATVVLKLFNIVRPDVAIFGEKDYQQLQVVRRLAADLHLGVDIVGAPIVREADGLAMSSRNVYLTPDERQRAPAIQRGLAAAKTALERGEKDARAVCEIVRRHLRDAQAREDYVELVDAGTLRPLDRVDRPARLLVAAYFGKTRLIDNVGL